MLRHMDAYLNSAWDSGIMCYQALHGANLFERTAHGMKKKTMWIITMLGLCLVLYTIIVSRLESSTSVIFGGSENAFVRSDSMTFVDLNATATPEPTVDIWPQLKSKDFEDNQCLWMVNDKNLLSSAFKPDISKIERTRYMMYSTQFGCIQWHKETS